MARSWRWLVLLLIIVLGLLFFSQAAWYPTAPRETAAIGAPVTRQPASIIPAPVENTVATAKQPTRALGTGGNGQAGHAQSLEPQSGYPQAGSTPQPAATANEKINFLKQAFAKAQVAISSPASIQIGEKNEVDLLISFNESIDQLKRQLPTTGQVVTSTIVGSELMSATLIAKEDALEITRVGPAERQRVSDYGKFYWKWLISPKTPGQHTLYITVSNIIGEDYQAIQTYSRSITIEVSFWQIILLFIQQHWQWIFATILIPLLAHAWNVYHNREKK